MVAVAIEGIFGDAPKDFFGGEDKFPNLKHNR